MKTRNWGLGILAVGAVAAVTAATIAPHGSLSPAPTSTEAEYTRVAPAATVRPGVLQEVLDAVKEPKTVYDARTKVSLACMTVAGYPDFSKTGVPDPWNDLFQVFHGFPSLTVDQAHLDGYASGMNFQKGISLTDSRARAAQKAYLGFDVSESNPTGPTDRSRGCRSEGLKAVYENPTAEPTEGMMLVIGAIDSARQDPAHRQALQQWSVCMGDSGFPDLDGPSQAVSTALDAGTKAGTGVSGVSARKIAVADVLCRDKTRLVQRIEDNLARYLTTAVEQRSAELAKLKTFREEAAVRASALTK